MNFLSRHAGWVAALLAAAYVGAHALPPRTPAGQMDLAAAGTIPVVDGGRLKPLDTVARTNLVVISAGRQTFKDVPDDAIRAVRAPTLVVMGDRDVATLEHATELTRLFPDARLLVLPGGHGEYLGEVTFPLVDAGYPELTARLIARFLDAPSD